jgi:hypothetical protein
LPVAKDALAHERQTIFARALFRAGCDYFAATLFPAAVFHVDARYSIRLAAA